jgi:chromosome segregation ATPase
MSTHKIRALTILVALSLGVAGLAVGADNDAKSTREREMLRRAQEALRQSQTDNSALAQGKADAEQKLRSADEQIATLRKASGSEQSSLRAKLKAAGDAQADTARQLEEAKRQIAALTAQQRQTAGQLTNSESQLKQVRQDLDSSHAATASCEAKNLKLYEYSQEVVNRYQKKGVWAALSQKEPVLGLGEVKTENVVQEYREKLDNQRISGTPTTRAEAR